MKTVAPRHCHVLFLLFATNYTHARVVRVLDREKRECSFDVRLQQGLPSHLSKERLVALSDCYASGLLGVDHLAIC